MPGREVGEAHPPFGECLVLDPGRELILELDGGLQLIHAGAFPVFGEAAAVQVEPGEAEGALCVAPGDADEPVVDPEGGRVALDPAGDLGRDRSQDQFSEDHVMHDPVPEVRRSRGECGRELGRADGLEPGEVDRQPRQRRMDRPQKARLDHRQPTLGFDR